jgi:hypothetical protein
LLAAPSLAHGRFDLAVTAIYWLLIQGEHFTGQLAVRVQTQRAQLTEPVSAIACVLPTSDFTYKEQNILQVIHVRLFIQGSTANKPCSLSNGSTA